MLIHNAKKAKHKLFWILAITLLDDYMKIRLSDKGSLINRGRKMSSLPALKVEFLPKVVINAFTFTSSSPNGCEDDSCEDTLRCSPSSGDPVLGELLFCTGVCGPLALLHIQLSGLKLL